MKRYTYTLVTLLCWLPAAQAEVYRTTDEAGNVMYTDIPTPGAEKVTIDKVPTYKAPPPVPFLKREEGPKAFRYETARIVSPAEKESIRSNNGDISIQFLLEPRLRVEKGDRIQFQLDDQPPVTMTATQTKLTNVDRGTHEIRMVVLNRDNEPISDTASNTFYLHRHSILQPGAKSP